ncbi:hypothetical protein B0H15DRAFT_919781 [Mycena belliarum]|uniref:Phosphatidate cytidylyltransferase n=1 Tax=Mycena belliarum TaxID=1033014 RepID=A0AAD6UHI0_9AGAR|nr:hypothetical protein B0H15DRAFT_919781 [Mycena belliae]
MTSSQSPTPPPHRRRASASPSRDAGVKGITRKVIRTLEGLGHLDPALEADDEADDESEVARALEDNVRAGKQRAVVPSQTKKIDWEIPRKVFHSSIGFVTLGLYLTPSMSPRTVTLVLWSALAVIAPTDFVRLRSPAVERVYERLLGFLMRESERHGTNGTLWYILGVNFALTFYPIDVATVAILILSWADTAASTLGRMYGPRTPPLPSSLSLAWLPAWENIRVAPRRLWLPFAPRKSTAGFLAACTTGALVALVFWGGVAGLRNYLRSTGGAWAGRWVPEGVIGGLGVNAGVAQTTPARFGVDGWVALLALVLFAGVVSGVAEALDLGGLDDNLTLPIISGGALMLFFRVWGWAVNAA